MNALQLYYLECMRINEMRRRLLENLKRPSTATYAPVTFDVLLP